MGHERAGQKRKQSGFNADMVERTQNACRHHYPTKCLETKGAITGQLQFQPRLNRRANGRQRSSVQCGSGVASQSALA